MLTKSHIYRVLVVADLLLGQHGGLKPLESPELGLLYAERDLGPHEVGLQLGGAL